MGQTEQRCHRVSGSLSRSPLTLRSVWRTEPMDRTDYSHQWVDCDVIGCVFEWVSEQLWCQSLEVCLDTEFKKQSLMDFFLNDFTQMFIFTALWKSIFVRQHHLASAWLTYPKICIFQIYKNVMYASCFEVVYECIMEIKQYLYSGFLFKAGEAVYNWKTKNRKTEDDTAGTKKN